MTVGGPTWARIHEHGLACPSIGLVSRGTVRKKSCVLEMLIWSLDSNLDRFRPKLKVYKNLIGSENIYLEFGLSFEMAATDRKSLQNKIFNNPIN